MAVLIATTFFVATESALAADLPSLARGDSGPLVLDLQSQLHAAGHDPGPIDGVFGKATRRAVRDFQRSAALPITGIVDPATWAALEIRSPSVVLEKGDRGAAVLDLQKRLANSGHDPGPLDGVYGLRTVAAVGGFQTAATLSVTGIVDRTTWDRLLAQEVVLVIGDRGDAVAEVQTHLATLGFSPGPTDGKFGLRTQTAVRAFQGSVLLRVTGSVDAATLAALRAADTGPGDVTLRRGDSGPEVLALQTRLARVGFGPGSLDGRYGAGTEAAVARFQKTFNLPGAGALNQVTLTRLSAFERDAGRGYSAGYTPGAGAEQWRDMITEVFARWDLDHTVCADDADLGTCVPAQVDAAIAVIACESHGIPFAVNVTSGTTGLFQHRMIYWAERVKRVQAHFPDFPSDASAYDPEHNAMVAALLVYESRGALLRKLDAGSPMSAGPHPWSHWSCRRVVG